MFKLIRMILLIVFIGLLLNMIPSSLITDKSDNDSIIKDFRNRLSQVDFVSISNDVISGWKNLMSFVTETMEGNDGAGDFIPAFTNQGQSETIKEVDLATFEPHKFEIEVLQLVNIEREKHGLKPLDYSKEVSVVAREKSRDMANYNYFAHESPNYGSPFEMMDLYGVQYWAAGENIARGHLTPEHVMEGWMNSEGHRANILNDSFTHLGVGFVNKNGVYYWTQMFIGK